MTGKMLLVLVWAISAVAQPLPQVNGHRVGETPEEFAKIEHINVDNQECKGGRQISATGCDALLAAVYGRRILVEMRCLPSDRTYRTNCVADFRYRRLKGFATWTDKPFDVVFSRLERKYGKPAEKKFVQQPGEGNMHYASWSFYDGSTVRVLETIELNERRVTTDMKAKDW